MKHLKTYRLFEGEFYGIEPLYDDEATTPEEAMDHVRSLTRTSLNMFQDVIWVGEVTGAQLEDLADDNKGKAVVVGEIIDGVSSESGYWYAYSYSE
jgi:hypothetical protein